MALFLRGNIWWMEYRTRSVRRVVSTGFRRAERGKAQSAYDALRLAMGAKPKRDAMSAILDAIYGDAKPTTGIPLGALWSVYEDWANGKARKMSHDYVVSRRNTVTRFVEWAAKRDVTDLGAVSVLVARDYVRALAVSGKGNKTQRNYCGYLGQIWNAVGQLHPGVHNPWPAATPDDDGSSQRKEMFTEAQVRAVLAAAQALGHDWWLASTIALYTGLRYGDVATLDWRQVDLATRVITTTPNKTKGSSGIEVMIPMAEPLFRALSDAARNRPTRGFVLPEHGIKYTAGQTPQPLSVPFAEVLKKAGVDGERYTFHSWRHTANTRMAEAGVPSEIRQMICGWTNDAMARHYDHATHLAELSDAVARI